MASVELPAGLANWMRNQRWYTSKGSTPNLERRGGWEFTSGPARIETHFVLDRQPRGATLYQVPISFRDEPIGGPEPLWHDAHGYAYDAPHDPEYARAILRIVSDEAPVGDARGHRQPGARAIAIESTSVLTGEQSNTSIICSVAEGGPVILKIFRALHAGDNPDVVLQSAISAAGSDLVPASIGYLSGEWPDSAEDGGVARGHIAFVQDFQIGAEDGWRLALRAAEDREDFTRRASLLGRATAELHETLAAVLPTSEAGPDDIERFVNAMAGRAESALAEVPDLEPMRAQIEAAINASRDAAWPPLQRIHGDYHLGQVLWVDDPDEPGSGRWLIIDFEGEPLRPMRERSASDIALRDVAGMLRSFDYVPGAVAHRALPSVGTGEPEGANSDLESWAQAARNAFLSGYSDRAGFDLTEFRALQGAFELDKALYEAVYEAGNRPDWLGIPVAAITRLISN